MVAAFMILIIALAIARAIELKQQDEDEEDEPHSVCMVRCSLCSFKWVAVYPSVLDDAAGDLRLECDNCGNTTYVDKLEENHA